MQPAKNQVKTSATQKLRDLVTALDAVLSTHVDEFTPAEVRYVLENYKGKLVFNLQTDFERARPIGHTGPSPFDFILNQDNS